jgi:hypothetical protein
MIFNGPKYLHSLIYFIADQPTEDNLSAMVPLVGTESYKTLLKWIGEMNIDITRVRMYNQCDGPFDDVLSRTSLNTAVEAGQIKVIALGQKAARYLANVGVNEFFLLPHPSGRNRLLNDKTYVIAKLGACRQYIYEGVLNGQQECEEGIEENLQQEQEFPSPEESEELE